MGDVAHIVHVLTGFAVLVGRNAGDVDLQLLLIGLLLQLAADAVRNRGWFNIVCAACPSDPPLRMRDLLVAYFAGAGLGAVVPARGGDVVKVALLQRRLPGSKLSTLAATLVPETLFECVAGAALVLWALHSGNLPTRPVTAELPAPGAHPVATAVVAVAACALLAAAAKLVGRRRGRRLLERLRQGLTILHDPVAYVVHVVSWQALGRVIRLAALACYLAAFHVTVTLNIVLLVMAIDGGARIQIGPVATALRAAIYAYALPRASGGAITPGEAVGFTLGLRVFTTFAGLSVSLGVLAAVAVRTARDGAAAAASSAAATWRNELAALLRRARPA